MQKTPLSRIFREELTRASIFGVGFFTILSLGFVSVSYAANGGIFGEVLNKILASGNWETPGDGSVKNALKIGGNPASSFVKLGTVRSCAPKCITGFDNNGDAQCSP